MRRVVVESTGVNANAGRAPTYAAHDPRMTFGCGRLRDAGTDRRGPGLVLSGRLGNAALHATTNSGTQIVRWVHLTDVLTILIRSRRRSTLKTTYFAFASFSTSIRMRPNVQDLNESALRPSEPTTNDLGIPPSAGKSFGSRSLFTITGNVYPLFFM